MLDIEYIRSHKAEAKKGVKARGVDEGKVDRVLEIDEKRRALLKDVEALRAERNTAAKSRDIEAGKKLKGELDKKEKELAEIEAEFKAKLWELPNLPFPDVPVGDASKNEVLKESGKPKDFPFEPKDHLQIGEWLGIIDTQSAAKISGSRFAYLKNEAAALEFALVNFAMERLIGEGFSPVLPPMLIRQDITAKLGYWQAGGNENYYLVRDVQDETDNPLYLIGTGEHAIVPIHENETLPAEELPKRYAAYSACFRREAGTYGKDMRGIIRVHQFDKVEMVCFVKPEDAPAEFEKMLSLSYGMMEELGLPIRQVVLSTEDASFPAAKTVDIETWFPSQKTYRETHSISTTTDFQARRLNTRYQESGKTNFVHILNGTSFAIGRTLAAILENYQREDGSVEVPEVLRNYTGFDEIKPT